MDRQKGFLSMSSDKPVRRSSRHTTRPTLGDARRSLYPTSSRRLPRMDCHASQVWKHHHSFTADTEVLGALR